MPEDAEEFLLLVAEIRCAPDAALNGSIGRLKDDEDDKK